MNILLVEDNELNRDALQRRLEKRGHHVIAAINGKDAVQMAQDKRPDIVLMDLNLPIMSGLDATRMIKANPLTQKIPVIALTAHAMTEDREKAINAGCDDYDTKPVDFGRLLKKMDEVLLKNQW